MVGDKIKVNWIAGNVTCLEEEECYILVGKPERKRPLRSMIKYENKFNMHFKETGREVMECIYVIQNSDQWQVLVYIIMNLRIP